ncbi:MAG TPA: hypothetical protein VNR64_13080, partial [Vicinamibacterales bacterium]|nr:hypothetical protein [Vicinamibacterales bacterium]
RVRLSENARDEINNLLAFLFAIAVILMILSDVLRLLPLAFLFALVVLPMTICSLLQGVL